jgi:aryl-alcohol dehydrogenase-like predicted oxidoreductase
MRQRRIGDREVGAIGLGGAGWSLIDPPDDDLSLRTILAAIDAGVTLIDTALAYTTLDHPAHNELLIAKALREHPDGKSVLVATKGGHHRAGPTDFPIDGRPETIRRHCDSSLRSLGVERIDLYQLHWPDPAVPLAETMGAFAELRRAGKIDLVGMCNVSVAQIEEASAVVTVASVQNHYSPFTRDDSPTIEHCQRAGIAYLPYSPLGGPQYAGSMHRSLPAFARVAARHDVSTQRVVLAWHLAQSPAIVPIAGARRPRTIVDSALAADLTLTPDDLALLP